MTAKTNNTGRLEVHIPVMFNEYPLSEFFKETHKGTPINGHEMVECFGLDIAAKMIKEILVHIPDTADYVDGSHYEDCYFAVESFYGTPEELRVEAEAYLVMLMLTLKGDLRDDAHFNYLPSAVEEFIFLCEQIGTIDLIQRLYDSIWGQDHPYHPVDEDEVELYRYFENINGVTLHPDHPLDYIL